MTFLDPELRDLTLARFRAVSAEGTGLPQGAAGDALARAELLREIHHVLYDEVKFGAYPPAEHEGLAHVGDVIEDHAMKMWGEASGGDGPRPVAAGHTGARRDDLRG